MSEVQRKSGIDVKMLELLACPLTKGPLVWDEGEETAIQSPRGGSKLTWSGPPLMARDTPDRISFHLAADGPEDLARLVELGAGDLGGGRFLDPDGNTFTVATGQMRSTGER